MPTSLLEGKTKKKVIEKVVITVGELKNLFIVGYNSQKLQLERMYPTIDFDTFNLKLNVILMGC